MPRSRSTTTILLIEDDERDRRMLLDPLRAQYNIEVAVDYNQAKEKINKCGFDVVFLDLMLPRRQGERIDQNGKLGLDLIRIVREKEPLTPIVVISGLASVKTAMKVLKEGIVDFIVKDDLEDQLPVIMRRAELIRQGRVEQLILRRESQWPDGGYKLVYRSKVMEKLIDQVRSLAQGDASVLLLGETGTGKELIARDIHARSPRVASPFVAVNCGAIPATLIESELFGHEKSAFTDAARRKLGLFELANRGTIFLDEITDLPINLQVKLLRVLQERNFRRVGGEKTLPLNVRVIAATNRNIKTEIKAGWFREDLFFRIAVMQLEIPPLRDRSDDIEVLTAHFIEKHNHDSGLSLSPKVIRLLKIYSWSGNVRELESVIQRMMMIYKGQGKVIYPWDIADCIPTPHDSNLPFDEGMFDLVWIEKQVIEKALQQFDNQQDAVKHLRISESQLRRKIKDYGIEYSRSRKDRIVKNKVSQSSSQKKKSMIIQLLEKRGEVSTQDVMQLLGNASRKTAVKHLNALIEVKEVARTGRGRYIKVNG
ncbi:MAG: sigma-54 dependent transcriptional regulator [Candidatus Hatepunaea meridiana]|nr:sigma-54 dependent transcriptional regulator [Candidatus Hatepunaea meridiana]